MVYQQSYCSLSSSSTLFLFLRRSCIRAAQPWAVMEMFHNLTVHMVANSYKWLLDTGNGLRATEKQFLTLIKYL